MPGTRDPVPHLQRLSAIAGHYRAIICDVWGVLHNGIAAVDGAPEALQAARAAGLPIVLLTNAPRPAADIARQLADFGISEASYDRIVSSGAVTRTLIAARGGEAFHHLGPARNIPLFAGLAARLAPFDAARYLLCTGLLDDETEAAEDYRPLLEAALGRNLPLLCANPDLVVERGDRLIPCAGAIGDLYQRMGGDVTFIGKPHPLVYAHARRAVDAIAGKPVSPERILCIGDAFRTDIAGARGAGLDCLMTLAGIHARELALEGESYDQDAFDRLAAASGAWPTATIRSLVW